MEPLSLSDRELVALLVGEKTAARLYQGSLQLLFAANPKARQVHPKVAGAIELARRLLKEELVHRQTLGSPAEVRDYIRLLLLGREHEVFVVLYLDAQHRLIESEELFRGTLTQTSVYPREVVKRALRFNAGAVIFAHNHPSGIAEPSRADELLTRALKEALTLVDVRVLDHFVVAATTSVSFSEKNLL